MQLQPVGTLVRQRARPELDNQSASASLFGWERDDEPSRGPGNDKAHFGAHKVASESTGEEGSAQSEHLGSKPSAFEHSSGDEPNNSDGSRSERKNEEVGSGVDEADADPDSKLTMIHKETKAQEDHGEMGHQDVVGEKEENETEPNNEYWTEEQALEHELRAYEAALEEKYKEITKNVDPQNPSAKEGGDESRRDPLIVVQPNVDPAPDSVRSDDEISAIAKIVAASEVMFAPDVDPITPWLTEPTTLINPLPELPDIDKFGTGGAHKPSPSTEGSGPGVPNSPTAFRTPTINEPTLRPRQRRYQGDLGKFPSELGSNCDFSDADVDGEIVTLAITRWSQAEDGRKTALLSTLSAIHADGFRFSAMEAYRDMDFVSLFVTASTQEYNLLIVDEAEARYSLVGYIMGESSLDVDNTKKIVILGGPDTIELGRHNNILVVEPDYQRFSEEIYTYISNDIDVQGVLTFGIRNDETYARSPTKIIVEALTRLGGGLSSGPTYVSDDLYSVADLPNAVRSGKNLVLTDMEHFERARTIFDGSFGMRDFRLVAIDTHSVHVASQNRDTIPVVIESVSSQLPIWAVSAALRWAGGATISFGAGNESRVCKIFRH